MTSDSRHWQQRLDALAHEHGVVGASLAIAIGDTTLSAASGVLNIRSGQPATSDSLFQVGSITKVWTATLVMQLVDEGRLDLDVPVVEYLPEFRVADAQISASVTARQLLSHSSGIDGDLFVDTGRGDDALRRFVAAMADLRRIVPPGKVMSYGNSGYSLLGHLVATLRGMSWEQVMHEHLLRPLGLGSAGTLPEEALLHSVAAGHFLPPGADAPAVTPQWGMPRSVAPAGAIHSTAAQQLAFARLHINEGVAANGKRLLSAASAKAMLQPQLPIADRWLLGTHAGLGWFLNDWGEQPVYGHDGTTLGQNAFLRVLPQKNLAMCLLMNGGRASRALFQQLFAEIAMAFAGVAPLPLPVARDGVKLEAARFVGRYIREGLTIEIVDKDGALTMIQTPKSVLGFPAAISETTLVAHSEDVLLMAPAELTAATPLIFFDVEGQRYLQFAARTVARETP